MTPLTVEQMRSIAHYTYRITISSAKTSQLYSRYAYAHPREAGHAYYAGFMAGWHDRVDLDAMERPYGDMYELGVREGSAYLHTLVQVLDEDLYSEVTS